MNGLSYIPEFLDKESQLHLLQEIDSHEWSSALKRRTQHYGYVYDYTKKNIDKSMFLGPLPSWLLVFAERLVKDNIFAEQPDQVIINEYLPGQGISRHIDCVPCFGRTIASLSLGSQCIMQLENSKLNKTGNIALQPGSLLVLQDEARYDWMHSIPARSEDLINKEYLKRTRRVSLTFRNVNHEQK